MTDTIISEGKDLDNFLWEVIKFIKDTLIYKTTKKLELYSKEDIEFITNLANEVTKERLLKLIYELSELANSMKISTQKNIIFQTGIIKACMEIEETYIAPVQVHSMPKQAGKLISNEKPAKTTVEPAKPQQVRTTETPKNPGKYVPYWQNVLDKVRQSGKMTIYANLLGTKGVLVNDLIVGIEFPGKVTDFAKKVLEEHENKIFLEKIVSMEQGADMQVRILDKLEKQEQTKKQGIEGLAEDLDLPFNVIDE